MKSSILKCFDNEESALKLKSLRNAALAPLLAEGESDKKSLKEQFETCLSSLVEKGRITEEDGVYSKALKVKSEKKRKADVDDDAETVTVAKKGKNHLNAAVLKKESGATADAGDDDELKIKAVKDAATAAAYSSYSAASANSKMDLSKFGEQAWKDGEQMTES